MKSTSNKQFQTLIELLEHRALVQKDDIAYVYIDQNNKKISYGELLYKARNIALKISEQITPGDRVLLIYEPGIELIIAYLACLYTQAISVPVYPPVNQNLSTKLKNIIEDCKPSLVLTQSDIKRKISVVRFINHAKKSRVLNHWIDKYFYEARHSDEWDKARLEVIATDTISNTQNKTQYKTLNKSEISSDTIAFLQYTSGSTGSPKGVMISHRNLLDNLEIIKDISGCQRETISVFWLPPYHDLGLIAGILGSLYCGSKTYLMSPLTFIKNPLTWLEALSQYKANITAAPNFAFDLCVKKLTDVEKNQLDLSHLNFVLNGAEPVRKESLDDFYHAFKAAGLKRQSLSPGYGLAEATLSISGTRHHLDYKSIRLQKEGLEKNQVIASCIDAINTNEIVSSGELFQEGIIVDPVSHTPVKENEIGELWVRGDSVAKGYWNKRALTENAFHAKIKGSDKTYLRTGDLGFIDETNYLYITGRLKDIIIINGRNLYPQEIEYEIANSHPLIKPGSVCVFTDLIRGMNELIVCAEVESQFDSKDYNGVTSAIRKAVLDAFSLIPYKIKLLAPKSTLKTTSGKIQRQPTKERYLNKQLKEVQRPLTENEDKHGLKERIYSDIKKIVCQLFDIEDLKGGERFSELGGTSLMAQALYQALQDYVGEAHKLNPSIAFDYPTLNRLAAFIQSCVLHESSSIKFDTVKYTEEGVAIIGIGCRLPGNINSFQDFCDLTKTTGSPKKSIFERRWKPFKYEQSLYNQIDKAYLIEDLMSFDAEFFKITKNEALYMDPQHRQLLEVSFNALRDAAINPNTLAGTKTSIHIGLSANDYQNFIVKVANNNDINPYSVINNASSVASGRLAYFYGTTGVTETIDTACSSSLVAILEACRSIQSGDTPLAIAGSANAIILPDTSIALAKAQMLSKTGDSIAFSNAADGYVRGEGCVVFILKRLSLAQKDKDHIYGVIKGGVINQDGASSGLTVPNGIQQASLIKEALEKTKTSFQDLQFIETHGSATPLGDPMEISAINAVFKNRKKDKPLYIASIKSKLGHLEATAGALGLINVLGGFHSGYYPRHADINDINPKCDLSEVPLNIVNSEIKWEGNRTAGVSSFGFSGTNAHLIVEDSSRYLSEKTLTNRQYKPPYAFKRNVYCIENNILINPSPKKIKIITPIIKKIAPFNERAKKVYITEHVNSLIKTVLGTNENISNDMGFFDLGLTSLMSVELGEDIQNDFGLTLKPTVAIDYNTVNKLADFIYKQLYETSPQKVGKELKKTLQPVVSIIGMSVRFPGSAKDIFSFWELLCNGECAVEDIPLARFDIDRYYSPDVSDTDKSHTKKAALIQDIDTFDPHFFGLSPREALSLDPQQRLLLEETWHALEDAGIRPATLKGKRVGIFVGISQSEYGLHIVSKQVTEAFHTTGTSLNMAAGRLAYFFGTEGPAVAIDTACSSSLVALNQAINSLNNEECELAIVAGVNALIDPNIFVALSKANILSPDGYSKTFDSDANGYVRGEGCGVIVLKPSSLLTNSDRVLANVRASAVNQDGASASLTAPNGVSQANLIKRSIDNACLTINDIDYIETHGTGTRLGDPIEVGALGEVFKGRDNKLILGSVKTNIGHLESAAGIAGVIKTILMLKHAYIPPHIHFKSLNPKIDLNAIPAALPLKGLNWLKETKRYAGVSSFGVSGTNAHVILEEADRETDTLEPKHSVYVFPFSAKTEDSLESYINTFIEWLNKGESSSPSLEAISATLSLYRTQFQSRAVILASTKSELLEKLKMKAFISHEMILHNGKDKYNKVSAFLKGDDVDFSPLFRKHIKPISIPTYVFMKEHYWLSISEDSFDKSTIHPLLKDETYLHDTNTILYSSLVSIYYPPFIKDHKLYDMPVIAGASYLSMLMSLVHKIHGESSGQINNLEFITPIVFEKGDEKKLQLYVSQGQKDNSFKIMSYLKSNAKECTLNAKGILTELQDKNIESFDIDAIQKTLDKRIVRKDHIAFANEKALTLGPHFDWIQSIDYNNEHLIARVRQPSHHDIAIYGIPPGLIDAAFQTMLVWLKEASYTTELEVPVYIDKTIHTNISDPIHYIYAKRDMISRTADIYMLDRNGCVRVQMIGFKSKKINETSFKPLLSKRFPHGPSSYYLIWEKYDIPSKLLLSCFEDTDCLCHEIEKDHRLLKALKVDSSASQTSIVEDKNKKHIVYLYVDKNAPEHFDAINHLHLSTQTILKQDNYTSLIFIVETSMTSEMVWAYWKTLSNEYPNKPIFYLEIDNYSSIESFNKSIALLRSEINTETALKIHINTVKVPRLITEDKYFRKLHALNAPANDQHLSIKGGLIQDIEWISEPHHLIKDNDVKVDIKYTSLNFRDVLKLMGDYPGDLDLHMYEHAGYITEIGDNVKDLKLGDKVFVLGERKFCTEACVSKEQVIKIPPYIRLIDASTIPTVYLTAYICLFKIANIKKDDKVLIHAGGGGVGLAAIQLAKRVSATLYVTAQTKKHDFLKAIGVKHIYDSRTLCYKNDILKDTEGRGVDVVLNSLTGTGFISSTLDVLKDKGFFIELSKRNIYTQEKMTLARPDIKYHIFALDKLMYENARILKETLPTIFDYFRNGACEPLPKTVYDIRLLKQAYYTLQKGEHIGKIIIKHQEEVIYREDRTFLVTGGLGGLGIALIEHLFQSGVKHIYITGRKELTIFPSKLASLIKKGLQIQYRQLDITDSEAVIELIQAIQSERPLGGVFHLAGMIEDMPIETLSIHQIAKVLGPKVYGSWNLHKATEHIKLDCFVMFSSIASLLGSPGQANYAMANAFMDKLSLIRQERGLTSLSLNLGPFDNDGMAKGYEKKHALVGILQLKAKDTFKRMDKAIKGATSEVMIANINWEVFSTHYKHNNYIEDIYMNDSSHEVKIRLMLEKTEPKDRRKLLKSTLKSMIADILGISDETHIDEEEGLFDLGLDSLLMIELVARLQKLVGHQHILPKTMLIEMNNINGLASYLEKHVFSALFKEERKATRLEVLEDLLED